MRLSMPPFETDLNSPKARDQKSVLIRVDVEQVIRP